MSLNFGQNLFPPRGEMIRSFNYLDLLTNQGHGLYYFLRGTDLNGATLKTLIRSIIPSDIETTATSIAVTGSGDPDINVETNTDDDFDLLVTTPMILKGKPIITCTSTSSVDSATGFAYIICRLKKNDVEIAVGRSETFTSSNDGVQISTMILNIANNTYINIGDLIRVTLELHVLACTTWEGASKTTSITLTHNPTGSDNKNMRIDLPFKMKM